jgi:hypothetical protein
MNASPDIDSSPRRFAWLFASLVAGCAGGCGTPVPDANSPVTGPEAAAIETFCARCHEAPDPAYFARGRWVEEVYRGLRFHEASRDRDVIVPPHTRIIKFFQDRAPEKLPAPEPLALVENATPRFRRHTASAPPPLENPTIGHLAWEPVGPEGSRRLVTCDILSGNVSVWEPDRWSETVVGNVPFAVHAEYQDLDGDGRRDFVVSSLGTFAPADVRTGEVRFLRHREDGSFESIPLADEFGRVCQTRVADFDADGLADLLVVVFGWQKTGNLVLMTRVPGTSDNMKFLRSEIDARHGAILADPTDWNGDGRLDFVTLFGQEHECVEVFLNQGRANFSSKPIGKRADPAFGSNGAARCDLDGDGDDDFVLSNGDMFDSFQIKPYHGIRWLENRGDGTFLEHSLVKFPGVHGVSTGDLDGDGDLDLAAAACFPYRAYESAGVDERAKFVSALWLEQTSPGRFSPHVVETGSPFHAASTLADIDGDGDLDFVCGLFGTKAIRERPPFVVFENLSTGSRTGE